MDEDDRNSHAQVSNQYAEILTEIMSVQKRNGQGTKGKSCYMEM